MKKQTDIQKKEKQEMYETFSYFAAGGRHAKDEVKGMEVGALETSKVEFIEQRQLEL